MPPRTLDSRLPRWVAGCILTFTTLPVSAQQVTAAPAERIPCPKLWDSKELASWATPVAGADGPPRYYTEEEY